MKRNVIFSAAIAMVAFAASSVQATTFMSDTFSYADGELTYYDGTGANVSSTAWVPHSGTGFPVPVNVVSGQAVLKSGNPASEDVNRLASLGGIQNIGLGETWYYAAMLTVNDERADPQNDGLNNDYFMHFKDSGNNFRGRAYVDDPSTGVGGAGFVFGLSNTSGGQQVSWGSDLNFGQQYKVVVSYQVDTGTSDMWIDPTDINSTKITDVNAGGAFTLLNSLGMRQDFSTGGGDYEVLVDAVALGNDFDSVMTNVMNGSNIPEPTTAMLALLGLFGMGLSRRAS